MVITQPEAPEQAEQMVPTDDTPSSDTFADKINVNTASAAVLESLPEIGPVLAGRIVAYREASGPFQRVDQLMTVAGIGPATFEAIRDLIRVGN